MSVQRTPVRLAALALIVMAVSFIDVAEAQPERPLVQEGKKALYQRVIAVPGAALYRDIGDALNARTVPPFSTYYVYERRDSDNRKWIRVGTDSNGTIVGWMDDDEAARWEQTLTVAFRDPAEQERVPLFGDRDSLKTIVDENDAAKYRQLRKQAEGGTSKDSPIVAIQPAHNVDVRRNFYLVPILDHEDVLVGGQQARLLHVATIPLQDTATITAAFRTGIVFVIDSTISMQPYIDATQSVMERVNRSIDAADLSDRVGYGLVAYRDNTAAVPGLEYVSRRYADLASGNGEEFLSSIKTVKTAPFSSEGFDEDAYAGIDEAIRSPAWNDFYARYVILITDAGPRAADDPLSSTKLDAASLQRLAQDKGITLGVFHLRTPAGADDHAYAEEEYRQLSAVGSIGDFYYPVATGDVGQFEKALTALTSQLTAQVRAAASGQPPERLADSTATSELEVLQEKIDRLGYGLRMQYLKEQSGAGVPSLFNAWMIDRDFDKPNERALDVRVLLTRDQLSDLHEVLRQVLITAEEGALAPDDFLDELKSLAASVSRDPEAAKTSTRAVGGQSLADLGYMREYLEGLPYKSEVMYLDLSIWEQWPAQRQFEFINQLDGKVAYYRALHDNVDLWVSLDGKAVDGDSVYPLLLEALP